MNISLIAIALAAAALAMLVRLSSQVRAANLRIDGLERRMGKDRCVESRATTIGSGR